MQAVKAVKVQKLQEQKEQEVKVQKLQEQKEQEVKDLENLMW